MKFNYRGFEVSVSFEEMNEQWEAFAADQHFFGMENTKDEAVEAIKAQIDKLWNEDVSDVVKFAKVLSNNLSTELSQHSQSVNPEVLSVLLQKYLGKF